MTNRLRSPLGHGLLILVLGSLAYANTLHVPFELDDLESIVQNPSVRELRNFLPGGPGYDFHPRRWVGYLSFALNYHFGGLDVTGYHLFNLAVHLGAALLVHALVRLTFRTPRLGESRLAPGAGTAALLAALFFLLHPLQTQAVTYVAQRLTSLATLLYLLSLVLYAAARVAPEKPGRAGPAAMLVVGSVAAAVLAMHTKEIAFTLPFAAALYELCFFRGAGRRRLLGLLPLLSTLPLIPLHVLMSGGDSVTEAAARFGQPGAAQVDMPSLHYLFTQFRVVVTYLRLLILPIGQNVDYDYPIYTSFLAPPVFASVVLLAALLAVGVFLHRRSATPSPGPRPLSRDPALGLVSFGIYWFFLTLSVESSVLPIADVIFEHRVYLPSVGLAAAAAVGILLMSQKSASLFRGRGPLVAAALAVAALAVATFQRNGVWRSNISLWEDTVRKSPGKVRPWYNLGTHLTDNGRPQEAISALGRVVSMAPGRADAWHNLGRAYLMAGRAPEAARAIREAVRLQPDMANAVVNLSAALLQLRRPAEAIPLLEGVRRRYPNWPEPRMNLAICYLGVGDLLAAERELAALQQLAPHLASTLAHLIRQAGTAPVH